MWDELSNCTRIPCCNCGAVADYARNNDEENLQQFLLDLDDSIFDTIYSQILSMKPLSTQSKAYSLITPKESHRIVIRDQDERIEGATAFAVQTARWRVLLRPETAGRDPGIMEDFSAETATNLNTTWTVVSKFMGILNGTRLDMAIQTTINHRAENRPTEVTPTQQ